MSSVLALRWASVGIPGGDFEMAQVPDPVPRLVILLAYLALAASAAALAAGAVRPGARRPRLVFVSVGVLGALVGLNTQAAHGVLETFRTIYKDGPALLPRWMIAGPYAAALMSILGAVVVAIAPRRLARRLGRLFPALAAAPFLVGLVVFVVAGLLTLRGPDIDTLRRFSPQARTPESGAAIAVVAAVLNAGLWAAGAFFWQAALGAYGARDGATRLAAQVQHGHRWISFAVGAKLVWVALGLAGLLPALLGGGGERWANSRADGAFAWAYASVLGAAAATWLARRRGSIDAHGVLFATAIVCSGLLAASITAAFFLLLAITANDLSQGKAALALADVAYWITDRAFLTQVLCVAAAGGFGFVLLAFARVAQGATVLLLLFSLWALPATAGAAWPDLTGGNVGFGRVELVTMDVAISIAVAALVALGAAGRVTVSPALLVVAVMTSALIAHTGGLLSSLLSDRATFYAAILFAPAFQFLLASRRLNEPGPQRPARVLCAVGLAAAVTTFVTVQEVTDFAGPGREDLASMAGPLIAVPLAATLVAAWADEPSAPVADGEPQDAVLASDASQNGS